MRDHTWTRTAGVVAALMAGVLCAGCSTDDRTSTLEIRIVQSTPADHLTKMNMVVWGGQRTYYAHNEVLLTDEDVIAATVITRDNGAPAIRLILSQEGQEILLRATRNNVGKKLGVIVDGRLQSVSTIDVPVDTGIVLVTGHMLKHGAIRCSRALTHRAA